MPTRQCRSIGTQSRHAEFLGGFMLTPWPLAGTCALFLVTIAATREARAQSTRITVLYDAFGRDAAFAKDWGFSALVEHGGKRILFDTGNDAGTFAANVRAAKVDLRKLDFVVISHRHLDHTAGLEHLMTVNPSVTIYAPKETFGPFGSALPSGFYRKDGALADHERYFDGKPPDPLRFGSAWPKAKFVPIDAEMEIAPGVRLIALVPDVAGTKELRELSLALSTAKGVVLVVG